MTARAAPALAMALAAGLIAAPGCQRDAEVARGPAPRGGEPQRLHSRPGASGMTINPDKLHAWSEQLCTLPPVDLAAALAALGIPGQVVMQTDDFGVVEPAPPGTSRVGLSVDAHGANQGKLGMLEITPAGPPLTRAELDRRFGAGNVLPRVDFNRPHVVGYRVEVPGAPFRCSVFANFAEQPTEASVANRIRLRRDAVTP